ncbi:hypothetical protein BGW42_005731 [Actinomortierella wolfii]|nr:hypothetical protein BGW42_005731 [Actinomortierella wolfii]
MDGESHSGVRNQATADMDESASICSDGSCDSRCSVIAIYSKDDDNDYNEEEEEEVKENGLNNDPSSPVPARQPAALYHKESDQYSDSDNDDRDWFFRYWATARLEDFRPSRATRVRRS